MTLVFQTFLARRSASQVVRFFRDQGLRLPRRPSQLRHGVAPPTVAAGLTIWRNPAYAGAFAYGKTQTQVQPGGRSQPRRLPSSQWKVIVHDRSPAYVTWETFARIEAILAENYATYGQNKRRGIPRQGAAMLQGLVYGGRVVTKWRCSIKAGRSISVTLCARKPKPRCVSAYAPIRLPST